MAFVPGDPTRPNGPDPVRINHGSGDLPLSSSGAGPPPGMARRPPPRPPPVRARDRWRDLNPPASRAERRRARSVATGVALELARQGASAVVLAGSWARGDARRASDIDLWSIDRGERAESRWCPPFLVNVKHTSLRAARRELTDPGRVGGVVPGWRVAVLLHDPRRVAARLQQEAQRFRWAQLGPKADRWVSSQIAGWAEEVVKLVRALADGELATAAVQRNLLAEALGFVVAVHRRRYWDSENRFWGRIGHEVGGRWRSAQRRALGVVGTDLEASCRAALELYAETVHEVRRALRPEHAAIARWAIAVAGLKPPPGSPGALRPRAAPG